MKVSVDVLKGMRVRDVNPYIVAQYAEEMAEGDQFPAIVVFSDGVGFWVADGFHRLAAAQQSGFSEIEADIREGGERDALLHACGANRTHGFKRSNADKRAAVTVLLRDAEWSQWTDTAIATAASVSSAFVGNLRGELNIQTQPERKTETGRKIKVGGRGRKPKPTPIPVKQPDQAADQGEPLNPEGYRITLLAADLQRLLPGVPEDMIPFLMGTEI